MLVEKALAATATTNNGSFGFLSDAFNNVTDNSTGNADLPTLVTNVINIILFIAGVLAVVYLIYSGILYITAAGNPDAAKKGQQGIINAVIGIVIIVLAFFIARAVANYTQNATG